VTGFLYTTAILLLVLGVLVFVHELGHYWAAKYFGVWVHRFAIGIGNPIKSLTFQRGETEWAIAWLPIGGYVKMASREEDPAAGVLEGGPENAMVPPDRVFEAKPIWQRMVIILAGVTLNFLFAWLVFVGLAYKNGSASDPTTAVARVNVAALPPGAEAAANIPVGVPITAVNGVPVAAWEEITAAMVHGTRDEVVLSFGGGQPDITPPVIGGVTPSSRAADAGLTNGDTIRTINGEPVRLWVEAVDRIQASPERELVLEVQRDGAVREVRVTPKAEALSGDDTTTVGRIGAYNDRPVVYADLSFWGAIEAGSKATWGASGTIFRTFRGLLTGRVDSGEVGGPIAIGQMAAAQARLGVESLLAFMALISVNLAVVNLLPIPVLDGGAFLILTAEGIMRRPLPGKVREVITLIGLGLVVLLMVLAFSNDIGRLLGR
jgi:regulator of sigma E protease